MLFWSLFLGEPVCVGASYFFCCTRFLNTEENYKSQSRQMGILDYWCWCWWRRWWSWASALKAVRLAVQ